MRKSADFKTEVGRGGYVIVVSPQIFKSVDSQQIIYHFDMNVKKVFESIMELQLVHSGTVRYAGDNRNNFTAQARNCDPCGGELRFSNFASGLSSFLSEEKIKGQALITEIFCSNPDCQLKVGFPGTVEEIKDLIFTMLTKQMVNDLPAVNFLDCVCADFSADDDHKLWNKLEPLGIVALAREAVKGYSKQLGSNLDLYDLGFSLAPLKYGEEFSLRWLQYLVAQEWQRNRNLLQQFSARLLGPKPVK